MEQTISPAIKKLQNLAISYRIFQHDGSVASLEQAAEERNQQPEQVIRSLLFHLPEKRYVMVLMPGPGQVPWKSLRSYLGISRITMATHSELLAVTGCHPGSVNPFSITQAIRVLIEAKILNLPEVSIGSCIRGLAIILKPEDMLKAIQTYEIVDFLD